MNHQTYVPGLSVFTGQSIGLPSALPGSGEAARGLSPLPSSSLGPCRAIGKPFYCPVNSETHGMPHPTNGPGGARLARSGTAAYRADNHSARGHFTFLTAPATICHSGLKRCSCRTLQPLTTPTGRVGPSGPASPAQPSSPTLRTKQRPFHHDHGAG